MRKLLTAIVALAGAATPLAAQDITPFDLNLQRVSYTRSKQCTKTATFLVPTYYLHVSVRNTNLSAGHGVSATARVFTQGFDKAELQALARTAYDDFVRKLRATGATVLTYDDIRAEAASLKRMPANLRYALPTEEKVKQSPGMDWAIAAPSDEQTFVNASGVSPLTQFADIVKAHHAALIMPDIFYSMPTLNPSKRSTYATEQAGIALEPTMKLFYGLVYAESEKFGWCQMFIQTHDMRLASDNVGELTQINEDNANDGWAGKRGDYAFRLDPAAFRAGVLRVAFAVNDLMVRNQQGK